MATAAYSVLENDLTLAQEIALQARMPVELSGSQINNAAGLPHSLRIGGRGFNYYASPTQIVTPGLPILMFLAPGTPANDNNKNAARLEPRLPARMKARPGADHGKLKAEPMPPPTMSVASRYVEPQIKFFAQRKIMELHASDNLFNALKSRTGYSHRAKLKAMDALPHDAPKPKSKLIKKVVKYMVIKAVSGGLFPSPHPY